MTIEKSIFEGEREYETEWTRSGWELFQGTLAGCIFLPFLGISIFIYAEE